MAIDDTLLASIRNALVFGFIVATIVGFASSWLSSPKGPPFAGFRKLWEPAFLVRLRFSWGARDMIHDGYEKYKDTLYRLARNDRDIVVIPNRYVEELRALPQEKLSSIQALIVNLVGKWSYSDLLLESDLHTRVLQTKVTPALPNLVDAMKEELEYAMSREMPPCDDDNWTSVDIYEILLNLVARISARVFVGESLARNEEWLQASIKYAEQATVTTMLLRAMPTRMVPFLVWFLPSFWRTKYWVKRGQDLLVPLVQARRKAEKDDPSYKKPSDFLQWMMDSANENDAVPEKLALRELIMGLASVHTTTMAAAHAIYDMCEHREYFAPLREELHSVLINGGSGWRQQAADKLRRMDSFLKESQRLNPASLLGFHRIVQKEPIKLSDGLVLPPGLHVCCASYEISKDPSVIKDQQFDGFRYYELRKNPDQDKKLQYAMTDKDHMHFGHGRYACPGRFFASYEIKMIIGELLMTYDFRFAKGETRPVNHNADEFLYPNLETRLLIRRRGNDEF